MNNFISLILFLSIAFQMINQESKTTTAAITKSELSNTDDAFVINDALYDLKIEIESLKNDNYNLIFSIKLKQDSYYISPYEKRNFTGKFFYDLGTYDKVSFKGEIMETPSSVNEMDKYSCNGGNANWVRVNTIYKQPLNLLSKEDFEVYGRVKFTIEPRCSLEIIPYMISYKNGMMTIKEAKC